MNSSDENISRNFICRSADFIRVDPWQVRKLNGKPFFALADFNYNSKWAYSALVSGVDANVARVVACLKRLAVRDGTLIVFTADQGHTCGQHGIWGKRNSTVPMNMYDTSLHIPLIWNLPGQIKPGQTPDPMFSSYDLLRRSSAISAFRIRVTRNDSEEATPDLCAETGPSG